jgi:hypothetical protein
LWCILAHKLSCQNQRQVSLSLEKLSKVWLGSQRFWGRNLI